MADIDWYEFREEYFKACNTPTTPDWEKPGPYDTINEDLSLKWNREEALRCISVWDQEAMRLRNAHFSAIAAVDRKIITRIAESTFKNLPAIAAENRARKLWNFIKNNHPDMEVFDYADDYIDLIEDMIR